MVKKIPKKIYEVIDSYVKNSNKYGLNPKRIILFGSYAKQSWSFLSDIDVCVVDSYKSTNYQEKLSKYIRSTLEVSPDLSVILMSEKDLKDTFNPIVYEIVNTGIEVYKKD